MRKVSGDSFATTVHVTVPRVALECIFDECDRYDTDETGGRILGTYGGRGRSVAINVSGIIEPGPAAQRTATYFQQDGTYQEKVFREIEASHPEIEHLGNWHTHHVNGYPTLSGGDRDTYHRTVNHKNHNTDFFYALLVTARNGTADLANRYSVRHFIIFRDDDAEYEIPSSNIQIVEQSILWPRVGSDDASPDAKAEAVPRPYAAHHASGDLADTRVMDKDFFAKLEPDLRPYLSKETRKMYWRGRVGLVDDSSIEVVVAELGNDGAYAVAVKGEAPELARTAQEFGERRFASAREAIVLLQRQMNKELFGAKSKGHKRGHRLWGGK